MKYGRNPEVETSRSPKAQTKDETAFDRDWHPFC